MAHISYMFHTYMLLEIDFIFQKNSSTFGQLLNLLYNKSFSGLLETNMDELVPPSLKFYQSSILTLEYKKNKSRNFEAMILIQKEM